MSDENLNKEKYQKIEKIMKRIFIAFIIVFAIIICFVFWICSDTNINIKTEYGDEFIVHDDVWFDDSWIEDKNSNFMTGLYYGINKKQFHSVCDNQYFRCYCVDYGTEKNLYIFKIKKYDEFFDVCPSTNKYSSEYMWEGDAVKVKSELLCDSTLMKICLPDLDRLYHDELTEMGKKFVNRDFEGLGKYGLTEDMINDTDSLEEKIEVMNHYLHTVF